MSENEMRAALVAAMESSARGNTYAQWTDTILPTVRRIAAEELRSAAAEVRDNHGTASLSAKRIDARAVALARMTAAPTGPEPRTDAAVGR